MKYGLMYYKETDNLGDDIQTYAAKRFLPHIDYYIDRENLSCFIPNEKEYVSMIMNGWFLHNKLAWPPSPYINPLLISMHFTSLEGIDVGDKYLEGIGSEYFDSYGQIGCRDTETEKRLQKNGVNTYFSGCMTLTLNKFENVKKVEDVVVVDVSDKVLEKIKKSTNREIKSITHSCNPSIIKEKTVETRMNEIEELLKTYQSAYVVITSRLHAALPSIALGTPVILVVNDNYEKDRIETFIKYVGNCFCESEFFQIDEKKLEEIIDNPKDNNEEFIKIRNELENKCNSFINNCENQELNINSLPDIKEYYDRFVRNMSRSKDLYEIIRKKAKDNFYEYKKEQERLINDFAKEQREYFEKEKQFFKNINELEKEKNHLNEYINDLKSENKVLKDDNDNKERNLQIIYNSKSWRIMQKYRNIKNKLKRMEGEINGRRKK